MVDWRKPIEVFVKSNCDKVSDGEIRKARVLHNIISPDSVCVEVMEKENDYPFSKRDCVLIFDEHSGEYSGYEYKSATGMATELNIYAEVRNIPEQAMTLQDGTKVTYSEAPWLFKKPFSFASYEDSKPGCYLRNYGVVSVSTTGRLQKDQVVPTTIEHYTNARAEKKHCLNLHEIIFTIACFNPEGILFKSDDIRVLTTFKICSDMYNSPGGCSMDVGHYRWAQIKNYATLIQTSKKKYYVKRETLTMKKLAKHHPQRGEYIPDLNCRCTGAR